MYVLYKTYMLCAIQSETEALVTPAAEARSRVSSRCIGVETSSLAANCTQGQQINNITGRCSGSNTEVISIFQFDFYAAVMGHVCSEV
jgi:hypothetical protein